jgi:hypothetical protein
MSNQELEKLHKRESVSKPGGCGLQPQLKEKAMRLAGTATPVTFIVGIGSAHGDDRVGWLVAEQLRNFAGHHQFDLHIA